MDSEFATNARVDGLLQIMKEMQQQIENQQELISLLSSEISIHESRINHLSYTDSILCNVLGGL